MKAGILNENKNRDRKIRSREQYIQLREIPDKITGKKI